MDSKAKIDPIIADEVPCSDNVTEYDEEHFITYLRLLDADAEGACKEEMARNVLGIDTAKEPERARKALESHLARACWMTEHGYRDLLKAKRSRLEPVGSRRASVTASNKRANFRRHGRRVSACRERHRGFAQGAG